MSFPRPCIYLPDKKRALVHGFFQHSYVKPQIFANEVSGQESTPVALIEFEHGTLYIASPDEIKMLDSAGLFAEYCWGEKEAGR